MSSAVGDFYLRKFYNEKIRQTYSSTIEQLVENIRNALVDSLHQVTWMDEITKQAAVDKAKAIATYKIFPNDPIIKTKLDNYYESLTLDESEFFLNFLHLNKLDLDYNFRQLHKPDEKDDWLVYQLATTIGAFYNVFQNKIRKSFR